ncbi:MAG: hypothetical protein JXA14_26275 [Anaerolineae bacterium]|nr:hypothetical protein [Anaerolineae bacterium]
MGKQRQMRDFACDAARLSSREQAYLKQDMARRGARGSGCLLLQAPLWLLLGLAAVICWLVYAASRQPAPQAAGMAILGGLLLVPVGVRAARRWAWRVYYLAPIVIGRTPEERQARGWLLVVWGMPSLIIILAHLALGFSPAALMAVSLAISLANVGLMLRKAQTRRAVCRA